MSETKPVYQTADAELALLRDVETAARALARKSDADMLTGAAWQFDDLRDALAALDAYREKQTVLDRECEMC